MAIRPRRAAFIFAMMASAALTGSGAIAAPVTSLPPPPPPQFGWKLFGADLQVSDITVTSYVKPDGSAGGQIIAFNDPVFDLDPDRHEPPIEQIGELHFQFALWRGKDAEGDTGGGAALFGGFELTDLNDAGKNYSFLQIVTDKDGTRADFDEPFGFVNGDFPDFDTSWNFPGTQYDYLDIPFQGDAQGAAAVSFETALICYSGNDAHIADDFTWSFTTDGRGGLTGTAPKSRGTASRQLLDTYSAAFPDVLYSNPGSCHELAAAPEPRSALLLLTGIAAVWLARQRGLRRRTSASGSVLTFSTRPLTSSSFPRKRRAVRRN